MARYVKFTDEQIRTIESVLLLPGRTNDVDMAQRLTIILGRNVSEHVAGGIRRRLGLAVVSHKCTGGANGRKVITVDDKAEIEARLAEVRAEKERWMEETRQYNQTPIGITGAGWRLNAGLHPSDGLTY